MATATPPVAERLSFEVRDAGNGYAAAVVTEHRATSDRAAVYVAEEDVPENPRPCRVFLFLKLGGDNAGAGRVHETAVWDDGRSRCSCIGASTRYQRILCRHVLGVLAGTEQGVW